MHSLDFGVDNMADHLAHVDRKLQEVTPRAIGGVERMLRAGGKKLRPRLLIAVAHHSGRLVDDDVITLATAVELVHVASLVHDDIMDGGTLRHGVSTINASEGADVAVLAGDYLLAKGCALAASIGSEAGGLLAETIVQLCEGQAAELADRFNTERTIESWEAAVRGKTSSLFAAAVRLGGMIGGLSPASIAALTRFADSFGLAYQCIDDIADFVSEHALDNKSASDDVSEGTYTLPVIFALQGPHRGVLKKHLGEQDVSVSRIVHLLEESASIDRARRQAERYNEEAMMALKETGNSKLAQALESLGLGF